MIIILLCHCKSNLKYDNILLILSQSTLFVLIRKKVIIHILQVVLCAVYRSGRLCLTS